MLDLLHPIYKKPQPTVTLVANISHGKNRQSGAAAGSGRSEIISALPLFKASLALAFLFTPPPFLRPIQRAAAKNEAIT
ncbi:hypothetical protein K41_08685 [Klebsiella pneumoniae]|nr:hypothetical protein K41_08685 [Klebsiella pneumoniae]